MIGRLGVRLVAGLALLGLVAGVPAMLAGLVGWPLPASAPSWDEVTVVLTSAPTERLVMNALAVAAWVVWAAFVTSLASEIVAVARHGLTDRHAQPAGRNPARMLALLLCTAFATGSIGHTAAAAAYSQPPAAVELVAQTGGVSGTGDTIAVAVSGPPMSQTSPSPYPRGGYLWEDPPAVLAADHSAGSITVDIAGGHHQVPVASGATFWDLAEKLLGDARRWPEIRELNPHYPDGAGNGQVLLLPHDATSRTASTADQATDASPDDQQDPAVTLTYEVSGGDWLWHIAGRFLGDEQRYPEIAALNPDLAARYPDFPDHIQPGDQLRLPAQAHDQGERPHATGQVAREAAEPPAPPASPPAPAEPAPAPPSPPPPPPFPPAAPSPAEASPSPPATVSPPQPTTASPGRSEPSASTPQPAPTGTPPGDQTEPQPAAEPADPDDQPGVVLPSGSWISFGLAALVAALAVMLRLNQRRRARLSFPIPTGTGPTQAPVPESLRLAERAGQAQPALDTETEHSGLPEPIPGPPTVPAAVGVDQHGDPLGLFQLPGEVIHLTGAGATAAARAALAAACATGVAEHPLARPQVVTTAGALAQLLPSHRPVDGLDPDGLTFDGEHLHVTSGVADAIERAEQEMLSRWRHLEANDTADLAALNARDDHAEQLPPLLLLIEDPGRHWPRLKALATCRDSLDIHVMVLDADDLPGIRVEADGTIGDEGDQPDPAAPVGRLSTLTADELADLIDLVRQAQPRPEPEPAPDPLPVATSTPDAALPMVEIPRPSGEQEPPVRLRVLGPLTLATAAGPVTSGVRARAYAVLALLASHPAGRTLEQLADDLQPADGPQDMRAALRADINSARATLRKATGITGKFVLHEPATGRYRIDPELLDVDLWRMLSAIETANQRADDDAASLAALQAAADYYQGDFATGQDQPVFIDHATTYRHQILSVYGKIAEIVELDNPDQAVAVLEKAAELDPVNEELHQRIMRIHGRAGRPDQVRRTLTRLEARLAEIGQAEPSAATRRVAQRQLATPPADTSNVGQPLPAPAGRPAG